MRQAFLTALVMGLSLATGLSLPPGGASAAAADADASGRAGATRNAEFRGRLREEALIYSGPGTSYYPVVKSPAGTEVAVSGGMRTAGGDWLKIVPPPDAYSLVLQSAIHRYGAGDKGQVTRKATVHAGSALAAADWAVQTDLEPNQQVVILEEQDKFFRIKPPAGAFVYVNADQVDRVEAPSQLPVKKTQPPADPTPPREPSGPITTVTPGPGAEAGPGAPATRGAIATASASTQHAAAELLTRVQKLEADFSELSKLPLLEQPIDQLLAQYGKAAAEPNAPDYVRRIVEVRISTLRVRNEAREQFLAVRKQQEELKQRLEVGKVEKQEIEQRIKDIDIKVYAAVGTLRTSSLQVARTPLYRLTDPNTGRTVVYVWGIDARTPEMLNQFVGVKGPMQTDARLNLKVVTPTAFEVVDPANVNGSVAAMVIPPSLLPKGQVAGAGE